MNLGEFLGLFKQGKVSAKSHMKNLIEMAMVDGSFDDGEKNLLNKIAKKYGVSRKQLDDISLNKDSIQFVMPENEDEKFKQLYELVTMMLADDLVHSDEMNLCEIFAKRFEYPAEKVRELIESIVSNIKYGQSIKETKQRVHWLLT
ncbi:MAG: hypothetical protein OEY34_10695 [Cyclobacteriaceae bacterium]|nr:hypothetical protein [Cyclobacteriaceae bacterium]